MEFRKTPLAIASVLMLTLTACANNDHDNIRSGVQNTANNTLDTTRNVNNTNHWTPWTNDVNNDDFAARTRVIRNNGLIGTNRNVSTGDLDNRSLQNMDAANRNLMNKTTEITPMNNGFITIDPNSYSTTMPSSQFPHTKRIKQGETWYYSFDPEIKQSKKNILNPNAQTPTTVPKQSAAQGTTGLNKLASQVIDLTNQERKKNGLPALEADPALSNVAQTKTNDMKAKNYFSHTSPTYGSPFDMMRDFGITYRTAGENIAMGQVTAKQVVNSWMNSEGHRKNILNPDFTKIGVGYTSSGNYWAQMFIGK